MPERRCSRYEGRQARALRCQREAAARLAHQLDAEPGFQIVHVAGHHRMRDGELIGRRTYRAAASKGIERSRRQKGWEAAWHDVRNSL